MSEESKMDEFNNEQEGTSSHTEIVTNQHYKKLAMVFFLVDLSNLSHDEEYLNKVNGVLKNLVDKLKEAQLYCKDNIEFKISIMTFANHSQWLVSPTLISDYSFDKIVCIDEPTSSANALDELNNKLSRREYMKYYGKLSAPMIFLFSQKICDNYDGYQEPLNNLLANKWFEFASRYAVIIDKDESKFQPHYFLSRFVSDKSDGIIGISDIRNIDFIPKSIHTTSLGSSYSNPTVTMDSSFSMSSDDLNLRKEMDDLANTLFGDAYFIVDESGTVHLSEEKKPVDPAAEARRKLREQLLQGSSEIVITGDGNVSQESNRYINEDHPKGHIHASEEKKPVDPAAEARRKLREQLLQGSSEIVITGNGNVFQENNRYIDEDDPRGHIHVPKGKLAGGSSVQCRKCGNVYWEHHKYCPECGTKQITQQRSDFQINKVNFSATAPRRLSREAYNIIHLLVYEDEYRSIVNGIIQDKETPQREIPGGIISLADEAIVKIVLNSPDFEMDYVEERAWKGRYIDFSIPIRLPNDFKQRKVTFQTIVYIDGIIATKLSFVVKCGAFRQQKISISREDILSAFISYASQDRSRAAMVVQGIRKARPDMDIFFDVETLRSGEDWENTIHQEIGNRDILYLFWSSFAKQSKWVDNEWRYAYSINGEDGIEPVPLEPAWSCPPPEELKNKHFNDNLLYIINQEAPVSRNIMPSRMSAPEEEIKIDKDYLISKMAELKELLDIGLYTSEEYETDRKALLESYRKQQHFLN